jgi:transposase-like protein
MISQKCPKCKSDRVRRGYRKTSIFLKIIARYHLLCDACNWEFTGFALPGTVTSKPKRKKIQKEQNINQDTVQENSDFDESDDGLHQVDSKKGVKIRS